MNGFNKLKNIKKTIDNKSIIKICDSDDDKSVGSNKICDDKIVDKSDGEKSDNIVKKKKRIRHTKAELFKEERTEILNKLNNILGITDNNKTFYIYDIDENKEKNIDKLFDDVKKYFKGKSSAVFAKDSIERKWLCIAKIIYKEMKFEMEHGIQNIKRDDKKVKSSFYKIIDPKTL